MGIKLTQVGSPHPREGILELLKYVTFTCGDSPLLVPA